MMQFQKCFIHSWRNTNIGISNTSNRGQRHLWEELNQLLSQTNSTRASRFHAERSPTGTLGNIRTSNSSAASSSSSSKNSSSSSNYICTRNINSGNQIKNIFSTSSTKTCVRGSITNSTAALVQQQNQHYNQQKQPLYFYRHSSASSHSLYY